MLDLFRTEAIEHRTKRLHGSVILAAPISVRFLSALLVAVVAGALIFACIATYARKETVIGWITPDRGLIRVVAAPGGRIETIAVREGDQVAIGVELATLRPAAEVSGVSATADELRAALFAERGEVDRQIGLQQQRVRIAEADVERTEPLVQQGVFPRQQFESRQSALLAAEQALASLRERRLSLERELSEAEIRQRYVVRAGVAGRVAALPVAEGQTLVSGGTVAVLVPEGGVLEAELYAPTRAAGFIRAGQEVRLMYDAFPHQRFGAAHGEISTISRTVLSPQEIAAAGISIDEPVFRVRVRLQQDYVDAYGERIPLQPGMLLHADIVVDRRSLMEWLLDPLYAAGRR
ncbi:MAG: HlyD family efflux transporter periplasmic adaptor subunit [Hyphomonadaceae bacterium]